MIYLIEYDRERGRLHSLRQFGAAERELAARARLELELSLAQAAVAREVVLLEAASEEDLLRTHRRYFAGLTELSALHDPGGASGAS